MKCSASAVFGRISCAGTVPPNSRIAACGARECTRPVTVFLPVRTPVRKLAAYLPVISLTSGPLASATATDLSSSASVCVTGLRAMRTSPGISSSLTRMRSDLTDTSNAWTIRSDARRSQLDGAVDDARVRIDRRDVEGLAGDDCLVVLLQWHREA